MLERLNRAMASSRQRPLRVELEPNQPSDGELVLRARAGDRWARGALYRRYAEAVAGMLARLLSDREDALDLLHDAYLYAFRNLHALRDDDRFRPWLFQIAVSLARSRLRRKRFARALGFGRASSSLAALSREAGPEVRAELAAIDRALGGASVDERIAWLLRHVEECSMGEVAAHTNVSLSTAKRRVEAADRRVRQVVRTEES